MDMNDEHKNLFKMLFGEVGYFLLLNGIVDFNTFIGFYEKFLNSEGFDNNKWEEFRKSNEDKFGKFK